MKLFSRLFIAALVIGVTQVYAQKKVTVKITYIQPYCGGARPTPEMEADALKPKPYSDKKIIIVPEKGKADSVKTDGEGNFIKTLKPGKYKLYESWRYYHKTPDGTALSLYDKDCLKLEWKKEFKIVIVTKEKISEEDKYQINPHCPWSVPCILEQNVPPRRVE